MWKFTKASNEEAGIYPFDRTEIDVVLAQQRINDSIEDGDHDDNGDRI